MAPDVAAVTAPVDPQGINTAVEVGAAFTDPGTNDTHSCSVDRGDTTSSAGSATSGTCTASHSYTVAGIYVVG